MTPLERLVAQRPDPHDLYEFQKQDVGRHLRARLVSEKDAVEDDGPDQVTRFYLSHELSRKGATEIRYVVGWENDYVGGGTCIWRVRVGPLLPGDTVEAESELGPVIGEREYFEGADVYAVRDAGVRLSWPAACWLYGAAHEMLVIAHHQNGKRHGNLRAERIRFGLLHRDNDGDPLEGMASPFTFPTGDYAFDWSGPIATDAERDAELAVLARAVTELTAHPDPTIDRLLHDRDARLVLADALLERGAPVDRLLHDLVGNAGLAIAPYPEADIDREFAALWRTVIELEPMIDKSKPGLWELPRLGDKPYPGA